jgi:hypothetical protein
LAPPLDASSISWPRDTGAFAYASWRGSTAFYTAFDPLTSDCQSATTISVRFVYGKVTGV